jgi:hypothetical protein
VGKERPAGRWFREFFFQKKSGVDAVNCQLRFKVLWMHCCSLAAAHTSLLGQQGLDNEQKGARNFSNV